MYTALNLSSCIVTCFCRCRWTPQARTLEDNNTRRNRRLFKIVYLKCSSNSKSSTVYKLFLEATRRYGLPSRVRSDEGGENYAVALHMLRHRGIERNSVITGTSIHNQRIEHLWRDVHQSITILYYRLFYFPTARST